VVRIEISIKRYSLYCELWWGAAKTAHLEPELLSVPEPWVDGF